PRGRRARQACRSRRFGEIGGAAGQHGKPIGGLLLHDHDLERIFHGVHTCPQLIPTLLPFTMTSPDAFRLILPLPSTVMSLPLIVMVPSFFIVMLALPVLLVI